MLLKLVNVVFNHTIDLKAPRSPNRLKEAERCLFWRLVADFRFMDVRYKVHLTLPHGSPVDGVSQQALPVKCKIWKKLMP